MEASGRSRAVVKPAGLTVLALLLGSKGPIGREIEGRNRRIEKLVGRAGARKINYGESRVPVIGKRVVESPIVTLIGIIEVLAVVFVGLAYGRYCVVLIDCPKMRNE